MIVSKVVGDALIGVAYHDDSQIVYAEVNKYYADRPRTEIRLWNIRCAQAETVEPGKGASPGGIQQTSLWGYGSA